MTRPALFLGLDGGASSTTVVIADGRGRILGRGRAGPVDHLYKPAGRRRTRAAFEQSIGSALGGARVRGPLRSAVAGVTGLEPGSPEAQLAARMLRRIVRVDTLWVTGDVEIAFAGAAAGGTAVR